MRGTKIKKPFVSKKVDFAFLDSCSFLHLIHQV